MIDTPGIRSFGLAHIQPDDVIVRFPTWPKRSKTARAAADTWVHPPIPNARWTP